ncbi:ABC transporter permease [Brevibacterium sp. UCMA 11754]|uniref:ABC transporter permease n=1 Tax=Brevibacterium sp. UCMA 11754 TaxID=2749198 RepID=UPI001F353590|nr:ABC transporter permease [Brevibacterium sp. UCMA 11754]MCF2571137.1 ABC transporter permease [Brevibacterium sp. UCMA 11754]
MSLEFLRDYGLRLAILVAAIAIFLIASPGFRSESSLFAVVEQMTFVGVASAGLAVTMIAGELDLSVASMASMMGVVAVRMGEFGLVAGILSALLGGALLGGIQGFAIAKLGINSLVFTTGTLILFSGCAYIFAGGQPIVLDDFTVTDPLHTRLLFLSPSSTIAIACLAILGLFLAYTRPGRNIYAIGGSRIEATAAGVPVRSSLTLAFMASGAGAGLAGGITCLKGGSAAPEGSSDLLLLAVGAALIGGVGLYGGVGNVWNMLIGILIVGVLTAGMATLASPSYMHSLVLGTALIVLLLSDFLLDRVVKARRLTKRRAMAEAVTQ